METFTKPKELVANPCFHAQRKKDLAGLTEGMIDAPMRTLITQLNNRTDCFTLQCCHGHFLLSARDNPHSLASLPMPPPVETVDYKIAYIALCVDNTPSGRDLLTLLDELSTLAPKTIQFGSARWFWERQINSYALQVAPKRFADKDRITLPYAEALAIETNRDRLFATLAERLRTPQERSLGCPLV